MGEITLFKIAGITLIASYVMTGIVIHFAKKWAVLDIPNDRSAHTIPTPRGGGLGFVLVITAALLWLLHSGYFELHQVLPLIVCSGAVAGLGLWDDFSSLSARFRLFLQFGIASLFVASLPEIPLLNVAGYFLPSIICVPLYIILIVWFTNLYNFMDGIDGIAISQSLSAAAIAACVMVLSSHMLWLPVVIIILGASLGFVPWNWQSAKIFMGDVGSSYLGFLFACLMLLTGSDIGIWPWLIILGLFLADTGATLIVRALAKQNIFDAHQSHNYQQLARYLGSHRQVCCLLFALSCVWLAPLAILASYFNATAVLICAVCYIPLFSIAFYHSITYYSR